MPDIFLDHFIEAHQAQAADALNELTQGQKQTHWMWFMFPIIQGLGKSDTAQYYAIESIDEANAFIDHPYLGNHYKNCLEAVLGHQDKTTKMASSESKSLISKLNQSVVPLASQGLLRPDDVELGEDVLVAGYPYGELFSNTIKVTKGIVSANRGIGDDSSQFQMDAAVQAGNSGGPIYDENGNIVGIVVQ